MEKPPTLKGPLSPIPIADDTVWVTKDGEWVIVGRRTWDRKLGSPSASGSSSSIPARSRPRTAEDMGLVMGTGGSMPPPPPPRGRGTEPVLIEGRDPAKVGLMAAAGVLGVVLVLAVGMAVGMGLRDTAEPEPAPLPVLQPVELSHPAPSDVKPVFRTPPVPAAAVEPEAEDTGNTPRSVAGSGVLLGRALDDAAPKPGTTTFQVPPLPEAPPGETPHWLMRLATGWRSVGPNPERASKQFRRVASARPKLPDGHLGLGVALIRLGHPEQAVEPLCTASKLSPDYAALAKAPLDAIGQTCP